ncbi:DUF2911 domain-containing protein [Aquimarina gracilis]|uniref:DUF2911 domain-containing protein n=1 Tax=Aquimarina gracilis TaxID=874422 RepID=A0ABU5ZWE2_9FLAO|nr:DUF2911 domain-containing protein [Aquimarina gracilis]MEB3346182.1 DUF2911 domain-containing protein [Aquimarina gracilis]
MLQKAFIILSFIFGSTTIGVAQLKVPALSSSSEIKQTLGLTTIEIQYSRPNRKNRKIFGANGLVPFNEFWRTGANSATKIIFDDDVFVGDKNLEKGTYTILTKPGDENWEVNFYPYNSRNWNTYVKLKPKVVLTIKKKALQNMVETLTIGFDEVTFENANLIIAWEQTQVKIPIRVAVKEKVLNNIKKTMNGPSNADYFQAALFLHETKTNLEEALVYIQKVTKSDKALFFQVHREALILADLNRKKEAMQVAKLSLQLSKQANNKDFIRLNEKLIQKLSD